MDKEEIKQQTIGWASVALVLALCLFIMLCLWKPDYIKEVITGLLNKG